MLLLVNISAILEEVTDIFVPFNSFLLRIFCIFFYSLRKEEFLHFQQVVLFYYTIVF